MPSANFEEGKFVSDWPPLPPQPSESEWKFVTELRTAPVHEPLFYRKRQPSAPEAFFPAGFSLEIQFPDPRGVLETAYADFASFMRIVCPEAEGLPAPLYIRRASNYEREQYALDVTPQSVTLQAADTEGIRRGLFFMEEEMRRRGGPFLPLGHIVRTPFVLTRISRCFYGPINRPPKLRDELADDVDYYPEAYLNRLAHEGINVLWLTINWYELIPSRLIPEYGRKAGPRLEKLRKIVARCARFGIRIYPFCIEPAGFTRPAPEVQAAAQAHPDLLGHQRAFCTSTEKGLAYVEEAVRTLFELVPGLGGLIVIPVGERQTHCYSLHIPREGTGSFAIQCPRCAQKQPWEVLAETLAAMRRGMEAVDPEAELVAWPYGQFVTWGAEKTIEAARHIPPNVILQHNFETGGVNRQMGKWRATWDYWLSYAGPSELFRNIAQAARSQGTRVSAKLQVSCSHEVATTQIVPVPGILYRKFHAMRALGVSAAMYSWYFGSYPGLMTRAASELAFNPCPKRKQQFLLSLAQRDWGPYAARVAKAWHYFERGYSQYPTAHIFGYYGPMHDGPVWPLYLIPRRRPLAPTWQIGYPPSGDYIAECITNGFTLSEIVTLCQRMMTYWEKGLSLLKSLSRVAKNYPERLKDIGLATALGYQFRSGYHILRFYQLRERLADAKAPARKQALLKEMKSLVRAEIRISQQLLSLAEADSRLGFHSEAEGYKYFPALLRWRIAQLRQLLATEFPALEKQARQYGVLWPDYIGEKPPGVFYQAPFVAANYPAKTHWAQAPLTECAHWLRHVFNAQRWQRCGYDPNDHLPVPDEEKQGRLTRWQAIWTQEAVFIRVLCEGAGEAVQILVEPCRTLPRRIFHLGADGKARCQYDDGYIPSLEIGGWEATAESSLEGWAATLKISWQWLQQKPGRKPKPIRINVLRVLPIKSAPGVAECSWAPRQPAQGRLVWGDLNPATDFGWLLFSPRHHNTE